MNKFNSSIQLMVVALNSCFIGGMLLIALVLVPFWQSMEPSAFLNWFTEHSDSIGNMMIPLGPVVVVLAIASFFLNPQSRVLWTLTIVFLMINVAYFIFYHKPTNTIFSEQSIAIDAVSGELSNWLVYHWQRLSFAFCGLVTSCIAVRNEMK